MSEYTTFELYNGKVQGKFFQASHQYWMSINGGPYKRKVGSTTIISIKDKSKPLMIWKGVITADFLLNVIAQKKPLDHDIALEAAIQDDVQKTKAANIGNEVHEWVSKYIKHKLKEKGFEKIPTMPKKKAVQIGVNAFLEWEEQVKPIYKSSERIIYSMKHDYMGTLDIEAMIGKKRYLIDLKTSNGLYNDVLMQTASYVKADEEESTRLYAGRWALRVSKYTEEEHIKLEERKKELRRMIAKIQGRDYKEYPIKPYQVFEAMKLDDKEYVIDRDFKAFMAAQHLRNWDYQTDFYKNKKR